MIEVLCFFCRRYLEEPGGLMFSPPQSKGMVKKFHVCVKCWPHIFRGMIQHTLKKRKGK